MMKEMFTYINMTTYKKSEMFLVSILQAISPKSTVPAIQMSNFHALNNPLAQLNKRRCPTFPTAS